MKLKTKRTMKMTVNTVTWITVLTAVAALSPRTTCGQDQVMVAFEVYRIRGDASGQVSLTDHIWTGQAPDVKGGRASFFTVANLKVAGVEFRAGEEGWTWNGKDRPPENSIDRLLPFGILRAIEKVAAPRVIQLAGQAFSLSVTASEPVEYFRQRDDGLYEHRVSKEAPGIVISSRIEEGKNGRIILKGLTLRAQTVTERKPLDGVGLDVGEPVFAAETIKTTVALKPEQDYGIQIVTKKEGILLVRLRVERLGEVPR